MFNLVFILDNSNKWQRFFQDPASLIMEHIITLYNVILFFITIVIFVAYCYRTELTTVYNKYMNQIFDKEVAIIVFPLLAILTIPHIIFIMSWCKPRYTLVSFLFAFSLAMWIWWCTFIFVRFRLKDSTYMLWVVAGVLFLIWLIKH